MHIGSIFKEKQDIETQKQDIDIVLSPHQQKQLEKLIAVFGKTTVFGRSDIVTVLGITSFPASLP